MALSKVLQKMAEKHQTGEASSSLSEADQTPGATAGILLTLLTERQQKPPSAASPSPQTGNTSQSSGARTDKTNENETRETGKSAASVLMQLLQKKKSTGAWERADEGEKDEQEDEQEEVKIAASEETHVDVVGEDKDSSPAPIVIEPLDGSRKEKKGEEDEASHKAPAPDREVPDSDRRDRAVMSTRCQVCHRGFWDRECLSTHMREDHGGEAKDGEELSSPSTSRGSPDLNKAPPPTALRRSKRKRRPARAKYQSEEEEDKVESAAAPEPKIVCVEGNVSMETGQVEEEDARKEAHVWAGEESTVSIEQITSFRCSKCYLYFNSHEETRRHLRQAHSVLTTSVPPNTAPTASLDGAKLPHSSCATCGCSGHSKKSSARHMTCLICGRVALSGMKKFINVFRARTWSSRHHHLAQRLTKIFGCKFSPETCRSKHACIQCVVNLETIEKAKLLRMNMAAALKRTKLVSSAYLPMAEAKDVREQVKTTPIPVAAPVPSPQVPAAPLVRELLSAPEVVLPSSQFTELIDALGSSEKEVVSSSVSGSMSRSMSPINQALLTSHPQHSPSQRSARRRGKRLTASQHDEAAFSHFVNELQSQRKEEDEEPDEAGESTIRDMVSHQIGEVLAVVKVKEEPSMEEDKSSDDLSKSKSKEIFKRLTAEKAGSKPSTIDPLHSMEEFRSSYTTLQIDGLSGQTEYNCVLCNSAFYSEEAIQIHVKCHLPGSKELLCFLCGFRNNLLPSQWRIMKRHLEAEHNFPDNFFHRYPCPVNGCAEIFKCHKEMANHVTKLHRCHLKNAQAHALADLGLFDFPCPMCGTLLQSEAALEIHILCHNGSVKYYQCYYCSYMHNSQPGSWRIMRGHLTKEHLGKDLSSDTFSYYECPYYACRLKFCSKKAQIVHRACHDETRDGEFFCFHCHFSVPSTPYLWEKVKEHIISRHPDMVGETFRCTCKLQFSNYKELFNHLMETSRSSSS